MRCDESFRKSINKLIDDFPKMYLCKKNTK